LSPISVARADAVSTSASAVQGQAEVVGPAQLLSALPVDTTSF
jgi:hypothetical protein